MKSIVQNEDERKCYICGSTRNLEMHHIYFGSKREISERNGMKVWLCWEHHRGNNGVHLNRNVDLLIKQRGQLKYEETHTRKEFMKLFGRNYLDLEDDD